MGGGRGEEEGSVRVKMQWTPPQRVPPNFIVDSSFVGLHPFFAAFNNLHVPKVLASRFHSDSHTHSHRSLPASQSPCAPASCLRLPQPQELSSCLPAEHRPSPRPKHREVHSLDGKAPEESIQSHGKASPRETVLMCHFRHRRGELQN